MPGALQALYPIWVEDLNNYLIAKIRFSCYFPAKRICMKTTLLSLIWVTFFCPCGAIEDAWQQLKEQYAIHCLLPSDIHEHLPPLRRIARECASVTEIGVRSMVSTWGLLLGLAENHKNKHSYVGIDLGLPPAGIFSLAQELAEKNGIAFYFVQGNDMDITIKPTDLLFIDTLHTYAHLTYELEKFSPMARKYIAMHDTSQPHGSINDRSYKGDYSEYPTFIDRNKHGLWQAVTDFLERHPEWMLLERHTNNHGLTVLKRKIYSK
jgi:hypothetical protein